MTGTSESHKENEADIKVRKKNAKNQRKQCRYTSKQERMKEK